MNEDSQSLLEVQSLAGFLEAKDKASLLLNAWEVKSRELTFDEALMLQGASAILLDREVVYGYELSGVTTLKSGSVYPILKRFEQQYGLFSSEEIAPNTTSQKRYRKVYTPTNLGSQVIELFKVGEPK